MEPEYSGVVEILPIATLEEHKNSVDALAIHPTKKGLFASGAHDRTIKLWDVTKLKSNATFSADDKGVWCLDYHP